MSNIVTLAGTPLTTTRSRPEGGLDSDPIVIEQRQEAPVNTCLFMLEAEMRRLLSLLGGDLEEWRDRVCEIAEKVGGMGDE